MRHPILPLFTSLGLFLVGHGLQLVLLPLHARAMGWSDAEIALTGSSYFAGFVIGCVAVPRLLSQAGHIRVFLCGAGLTAATLLLLELLTSPALWIIGRFLTGCCLAAIYAAVESWLNEYGTNENRGKLLGFYVLISLVGIGIGQQLLGFLPLEDLFRAGTIIMLLALVPVGLARSDQPMMAEVVGLSPKMVLDLPLLSVFGIVLGGIVTGSIWTMAPLVAESRGFAPIEIGLLMNALVIGGACFQLPLGQISDRFGRQIVLGVLAGLLVLVSIFTATLAKDFLSFAVCIFVYGGISLSLYTVCAAEANDASSLNRVQIASLLLLLNGLGSVLGPLLTGWLSQHSSAALFIVSGLSMAILFATFVFNRLRFTVIPPTEPEAVY